MPHSKTDIADIYYQLAQRASERFESNRRVEWQVAFGLWTALAAAIAAVITAEKWNPPQCFACLATVVVVVVLFFYMFWLCHINEVMQRDSRTGYFWETQVMRLFFSRSNPLPEMLQPQSKKQMRTLAEWPTAYEDDPNCVGGIKGGPIRQLGGGLHRSNIGQIVVAWLFALVLFSVLFLKAWDRI